MRRRRESRALTGGPSGPRTRARQRANKHSVKPPGTTEHPIPPTVTPALPTTKPPPSPAEDAPQHQPTTQQHRLWNTAHRTQSPTRPRRSPRREHRTATPRVSAAMPLPHSPFTTHTHLSRADPYAARSCQRRRQLTSPADIRPPSFRTRLIPGTDTPRQPPDFLPPRTPLDHHGRTQQANQLPPRRTEARNFSSEHQRPITN